MYNHFWSKQIEWASYKLWCLRICEYQISVDHQISVYPKLFFTPSIAHFVSQHLANFGLITQLSFSFFLWGSVDSFDNYCPLSHSIIFPGFIFMFSVCTTLWALVWQRGSCARESIGLLALVGLHSLILRIPLWTGGASTALISSSHLSNEFWGLKEICTVCETL